MKKIIILILVGIIVVIGQVCVKLTDFRGEISETLILLLIACVSIIYPSCSWWETKFIKWFKLK